MCPVFSLCCVLSPGCLTDKIHTADKNNPLAQASAKVYVFALVCNTSVSTGAHQNVRVV